MKIHHTPVLCDFINNNLLTSSDRLIVDFTLGEGGHSEAFLNKGLHVIAFEQDIKILEKAKLRLKKHPNIKYIHDNFKHAEKYLDPSKDLIDLALFDLGISTFHYKESGRGFSFSIDEPLDMRLKEDLELSAADIVNSYSEKDLADLFYLYGGEKKSRSMASRICYHRENHPIKRTIELASLLKKFYPPHSNIHPATRVFQALRIAVNKELDVIVPAIDAVFPCLAPGGKIAAISYHSLEDKIIKERFLKVIAKRKNFNKFREIPSVTLYRVWQKKPIVPSREEIQNNPSARSAKLRILVKED